MSPFFLGALGPSTIVGSASFNLLVILAICVTAVKGQTKGIKQMKVCPRRPLWVRKGRGRTCSVACCCASIVARMIPAAGQFPSPPPPPPVTPTPALAWLLRPPAEALARPRLRRCTW